MNLFNARFDISDGGYVDESTYRIAGTVVDNTGTYYGFNVQEGDIIYVDGSMIGVELLRYEQDEWDIDALKQQTDYFTLTLERKTKCAECYNEMIPYKESSVLNSTENKKLGTKIGTYLFIKDYDKIAEAIIKILYMLRCCLAHGDISPDRKTSDVYRYAYEVLLTPLLKLK